MRALFLATAIISTAVWLESVPGVSSSHSAVQQVAVDMDVSGNSATSLAALDRCGRIGAVGEAIEIDITATGIPAYQFPPRAHGISGVSVDLAYDSAVVEVVAMETNFLLESTTPTTPISMFSDPMPDTDGAFRVEYADLSVDPSESGDGVLVRVTLRAINPGATFTDLTDNIELDGMPNLIGADASPYQVNNVIDGVIAVGDANCESVDRENDGVPDLLDNCPAEHNGSQANVDGDPFGDACDHDDDGDGWADLDERRWGSNPIVGLSTPENPHAFGQYYDVCLDGVDNDLDGAADTAEAICGSATPNPANDAFENALIVTSGYQGQQSYLKATLQAGEKMPCGGIGHTLWYKFTAPADTTVDVFDWPETAVAAYAGGSLGALTLLGCEPTSFPPMRLQLKAGETVYFQIVRRNYRGSLSPAWFVSNSDSDSWWDHDDNCPYVPNDDQIDEDHDRVGNACDPTPRHDIAVSSFLAQQLVVQAGRSEVLRYQIRVANNEAHDEPIKAIYPSASGIPYGCQRTYVNTPATVVPANKTVTLRGEIRVSCPEALSRGRYTVTLHATVHIDHLHGWDLNLNNNFAATTTEMFILK